MKAREKKYFTLGFLSAILSLAVIAFAAAATQGHPWSEIQCDHCIKASDVDYKEIWTKNVSWICENGAVTGFSLNELQCRPFLSTGGGTIVGNLTVTHDLAVGQKLTVSQGIKINNGNLEIRNGRSILLNDSGYYGSISGLYSIYFYGNPYWMIVDNDVDSHKLEIQRIKTGTGGYSEKYFNFTPTGDLEIAGDLKLGGSLFHNMKCEKKVQTCTNAISCKATCPSGYYLVWGGCSSTGSVNSKNIWDSHCSAWNGNFCTQWECTTAAGTYIEAQAFCCK
ncbi:MAG: hypothetical protein J7L43_02895 [Candidatus Aenigmarchaeota archaeon]|nr:hypothetical protein [Candidatus Aenigmarchaeota archaeon]